MSWRTRERLWGVAINGIFVVFWAGALAFLAGPAEDVVAAPEKITATGLFNLAFAAVAWWLGSRGFRFAILALYMWNDTKKVQPAITWRRRRAMWRLHGITTTTNFLQRGKVFYFVYVVFGTAALALTVDPRWLGLVAYGAGTLAWFWIRFSTPPFVIYLSTSDLDSVSFHNQLLMLMRPLRAMSLLNIESGADMPNRTSLSFDCLRTQNNEDWWTVITMLMGMAPLIVINADTKSPGVIREARYILRQDLKYKTVFLTGGGARLLRTEAEIAAQIPGCLIARTPILEAIIAEMLDRRTPPSRDRSVWYFARAARLDTAVWSGSTKGSLGNTFTQRTRQGTFTLNPYLNIIMTCPATGKPVVTGVNSAYFEDWSGHPPKDGARFRCEACGQEHSFDNTNTWLERPRRS